MAKKDKGILSSINAPWITKDGYLDFSKFPIDSILRQSLSKDDAAFRSACQMLASMYSAGRTEAAVFLYGLLILHQNDRKRKEPIIDALRYVKTAETAALLFRELNFEIIGEIKEVETIAVGGRIRDIMRLRKEYGPGRWRKMKSPRGRQKENENQKVLGVKPWRGKKRFCALHREQGL